MSDLVAKPLTRPLPLRGWPSLALMLCAMAWLLPADSALAQQSQPITEEQKQACAADFKRLCPGTMPGGGRVKQCFEDHPEELSPPCAEAFAAQQQGS